MTNYFQGAALFKSSEITKAIKGFEEEYSKWENFLLRKIEESEDNYKPSWLRKIISGDTLYSRWNNLRKSTKWWYPYSRWMVMEGYVVINEEEKDKLLGLNVLFNPWSNRDEDIYNQLVKLNSTKKDCYLNAEQSVFIFKYSKEEK